MTVAELKKRLVELLNEDEESDFNLRSKDADAILWAISVVCEETVENGGVLTFPGFGKLSCAVRAPRTARNPRTGEPVKVPAKVVVKFGLSKSLKDVAPDIRSKVGKTLLADAQEKVEAAAKRRRQRERENSRSANTNVRRGTTVARKGTVKKSLTKTRTIKRT